MMGAWASSHVKVPNHGNYHPCGFSYKCDNSNVWVWFFLLGIGGRPFNDMIGGGAQGGVFGLWLNLANWQKRKSTLNTESSVK